MEKSISPVAFCGIFAVMGVHKKEKYKIVHRIDKTPNLCYNNA